MAQLIPGGWIQAELARTPISPAWKAIEIERDFDTVFVVDNAMVLRVESNKSLRRSIFDTAAWAMPIACATSVRLPASLADLSQGRHVHPVPLGGRRANLLHLPGNHGVDGKLLDQLITAPKPALTVTTHRCPPSLPV